MKKNILIFIVSCLLVTRAGALIIDAPNLHLFEKTVKDIDQQSLVLFDVDDTLIVPKDLILRLCAWDDLNDYIMEALENPEVVAPEKYKGVYFLGQILSRMEFELVEPNIVSIIHSLQSRNIKAIALTKMRIGSYGVISSMEDWRIEHLKRLHIDFSLAFPQVSEIKINDLGFGPRALFKQGLLCANKLDKGPALTAFLNNIGWMPAKVIFIDNRFDYLRSVEESLQGTGIEFLGFYYTAVENRPCFVNEKLAKFQFLHLVKTGIWLGDMEALKLMKEAIDGKD